MVRKTVVALTGSGISAESGLKTFRDAGGLWEGYRVEDVATPEAWHRNRELVLQFYNERRTALAAAQPNPGHRALVELESGYDVVVITQNVDDLHERAGSRHIIHLHGELTKVRSSRDPDHIIDIGYRELHLGELCPDGSQLRPHIVWFGEAVPLIEEAAAWVEQADVVLVIGTSLKVYPAAGLLHYAPAHARIWLIDPHPAATLPGVQVIAERASIGVAQVVQQLLQEA